MLYSQVFSHTPFSQQLQNNVVAEKGSPTSLHAQLFQTSEEIVQQAKDASKSIAASVILAKE